MNKRQRKKRHAKTMRKIGRTCAVIENLGPNGGNKVYFISRQAIYAFFGGDFRVIGRGLIE